MNKLKLRILVSAAVIGFMAFPGIVSAQQSYGRYYNDLEREFLENTGITNYQRNRIEKYCKELNKDPDLFIKLNRDELIYGNAFDMLEREYIEHCVGDRTELPAEGLLTEAGYTIHTSYQLKITYDENGNEIEEFVPNFFVAKTIEEDPLPESIEVDHTDYSLYPPFQIEGGNVLKVYDESVMELAIAAAKASSPDGKFKVDIYKQGEGYQNSIYYKDGEPFFEGNGDSGELYGYRTPDGREMTEGEITDAFLEMYPETPCKVNSQKKEYVKNIFAKQLATGVPKEEAYQKYQETMNNLDQKTLGELQMLSKEMDDIARQNSSRIEPVYSEYVESYVDFVNLKEPNFCELDSNFEDEFKAVMLECVNAFRIENGLNPIEEGSLVLGDFANTRAIEATYLMNATHDRPSQNVPFAVPCAENLALYAGVEMGPSDLAKAMFDGWLNSPPHKANILEPDHQTMELGISMVMRNGVPAYYAAQHFMDISAEEIDAKYADADTSVVKPKVMIADVPGGEALNEDNATEAETTDNKPVNKDFTKPYYTQLIVGDIPTVAGHTPTTLFTDRHELDDGTVVWSAHIGDQSGNRLGDLPIMNPFAPPDYLNYTYVYLTSFEYIGAANLWNYNVAGTNSKNISGNIPVFDSYTGDLGVDEYGNSLGVGENFTGGDAYYE